MNGMNGLQKRQSWPTSRYYSKAHMKELYHEDIAVRLCSSTVRFEANTFKT
jgi:hypothetical protein